MRRPAWLKSTRANSTCPRSTSGANNSLGRPSLSRGRGFRPQLEQLEARNLLAADDWGYDVVLQSTQKIVVVGQSFNGATGDFALARYKSTDGSLDPTFGAGGLIKTDLGGSDAAYAASVQDDDRIVVGGVSNVGTNRYFALVRYYADGGLDSTFGTNGKVLTQVAATRNASASITDIVIQPDGRIVAIGASGGPQDDDLTIVRYTAQGQLDPTFGGDGIVVTNFNSDDGAGGVAIDSKGRIVAAGYSFSDYIVLARYDSTGTLDPTFDGDGKVIRRVSDNDSTSAIVIHPDGRIITAGSTFTGFRYDSFVACFNENGSLNGTFGSGGIAITPFASSSDSIDALALDASGDIVAAGYAHFVDSGTDFLLARYSNVNGAVLASVITRVAPGAGYDYGHGVAIQPNGKLLVAGETATGGAAGVDFALLRYDSALQLDPSFGSSGKVLTNFPQSIPTPTVPGFDISTYALINGPGRLTFDPAGVLYTGRETVENVSLTDKLGRIGIGGSPVTDYGNAAIDDPDAVVFDATGAVSGTPGAVLAAGFVLQQGAGHVTVVRPDQSVIRLFGPAAPLGNITDMTFDNNGRLLMVNPETNQVFVSTGGFPALLFTVPGETLLLSIAVDSQNRIYTIGDSGILRVHDAAGNLLNGAFATGLGTRGTLAFGRGGPFGTLLYATDGAGNVRRIDPSGTVTVIGTGFSRVSGMAFGPDKSLYIGEYLNGRILRISAVNSPPIAGDDLATTNQHTPVRINVSANDSDPEGDPRTIAIAIPPLHGTAQVMDNGTLADPNDDYVLYVPTPNFTGAEGFTYLVSDGHGGLASATVTVLVTAGPFQLGEAAAILAAAPQTTGHTITGVTVITHGFQFDGLRGSGWDAFAAAITSKYGGWLVNYHDSEGSTDKVFEVEYYNRTPPDLNSKDEVVLLFDWAHESRTKSTGWGEAAGDALFSILVGLGLVHPEGEPNYILHFIGHSFGTAVTSEVVERLAYFHVPVDQVTYLDPHDFDEPVLGYDTAQRLWTLGAPHSENANQGYGATTWKNVDFADSYYQTRKLGGLLTPVPVGRPIPGAYNLLLRTTEDLPTPNPYGIADSDHSYVWDTYYFGTILGDLPSGEDPPPVLPDWTRGGFNYSRLANPSATPDRPSYLDPRGSFYPIASNVQDHKHSSTLLVNGPEGLPNGPGLASGGMTEGDINMGRWLPDWQPFYQSTAEVAVGNGNIFNGDFESGPGILKSDVPGWENHGGGGDSLVESGSDSHNQYLVLKDIGPLLSKKTHNWLYVPLHATHVSFDVQRRDARAGMLEVLIGDTVLGAISASGVEDAFVCGNTVFISPELRGQVNTLTFRLKGTPESFPFYTIHLDNIHFVNDADATPPVPATGLRITPDTGVSTSDGITSSHLLTLSGSLGGTGLRVFLFDVTANVALGQATVTGSSFSRVLNLTSGRHRIRVRSVDDAGNLSSDSFIDVVVDQTPPMSHVFGNLLAPIQTTKAFTITVSSSDLSGGLAAVDIYVSIDGAPYPATPWITLTPLTTTAVYQGQDNHRYAFRSIARDLAGNVESKPSTPPDAATFVPDLTPPVTRVDAVNAGTAVFSVHWAGSDSGGTGLAFFDVYVQVDGRAVSFVNRFPAGKPNAVSSYSGSTLYAAIRDGEEHTYRFYSVGKDGYGNLEAAPALTTDDVVVVAIFFPLPGLKVGGFSVQHGAVGRSFVRYVSVFFNQGGAALNSLISGQRIELRQFALDGSGTAYLVPLAGMIQAINQVMEIDFGPKGIRGDANSTIGDGYYELALDLDANGSFETTRYFYRLLGDVNGDRAVDDLDLAAISIAMGQFASGVDVNGDGVVNSKDRTLATRSKGRRLGSALSLDA